MRYPRWRRQNGVDDNRRSPSFERLVKEISKIRVIIADTEIQSGRVPASTKDTRILSKVVERVEEEIMSSLSKKLLERSWHTTTLIHDELILKQSARFSSHSEESASLNSEASFSLREYEDFRGWPPGTLGVKICSL